MTNHTWTTEVDYYNKLSAEEKEYLNAFNSVFYKKSRDPEHVAVLLKYKPDLDLSILDDLEDNDKTIQQNIDRQVNAQQRDVMNTSIKKITQSVTPQRKTKYYDEKIEFIKKNKGM